VWTLCVGRQHGLRRRIWRRLFGLNDGSEHAGGEATPADTGPVTTRSDFADVLASAQLGEEDVAEVWLEGKTLAVCRVEGALYAIDSTCPHAGGVLAEGDLDGHHLLCPAHGWPFDVRTGVCLVDPGCSVASYAVDEVDGRIMVAMTAREVAS
jgi:nitrite reductase/ring-hydroxylating ferredoxin subunit